MTNPKTVYIKTFGCQMNENDTETMYALLAGKGYRPIDDPKKADLVLVNSCSIREKSYQKALSELGRFKKIGKKELKIGLTGCVASQEGAKLLKRFPHLNLVLGTDHLNSLPEAVELLSSRPQLTRSEPVAEEDYLFPAFFQESGVKSSVTIMKGCDNACSFCIVPFVRGKEISRPPDEILAEIKKKEEGGVRELLLLGQNVNSYGKKLRPKTTFVELLRRIDEETGIARLRYTSPHPKDLSDELIEEQGRNPKLCRHIHLPVQSGSNSVLKRMRRSYTREIYRRKVDKLRARVPDIAISTDLIVGFPGETERDFEETLSLVREVGFHSSYSFVYSPRPQTEAFSLRDDLPQTVKEERLKILQGLQEEVGLGRNRELVGRREEVLVEGASLRGNHLTGRTTWNHIVNFDGDPLQIGAILEVRITEAFAYSLAGEVIDG
ncbi:MAG: tRNA (N6-isopentenyl adenosine(37)-C2)-methylthiotransferase MiaB [Deltaproteobacteria bacterium]|nr:tRNA (N6-isopentenyl adenosine(37)-C2)-methylthiotransferase MiaB [Deltaproteobacteria bacterium]